MRVIDLFSGPGGLGEGFASLNGGSAFEIAVSAEMEKSAHTTLTLRAFFRLAKINGDEKAINAYYAYCNSELSKHPSVEAPLLWQVAQNEARQIQLGDTLGDQLLDRILEDKKLGGDDTILIGGPPCQAYSRIGRVKNNSKPGYAPEDDIRHTLYLEYLKVLAKTLPAVFVMENVVGILSSTIKGRKVFHDILLDLCNPVRVIGGENGPTYVIHSLTTDTRFEKGMNPEDIDARDFVIKSENYGIPQKRHRVILLGVREDINTPAELLRPSPGVTVRDAIGRLPALRSQISPLRDDNDSNWHHAVKESCLRFAKAAKVENLNIISCRLTEISRELNSSLDSGSDRVQFGDHYFGPHVSRQYSNWIVDNKLEVCLNHQAKSHMISDLGRYLYASVFSEINGVGPRGYK